MTGHSSGDTFTVYRQVWAADANRGDGALAWRRSAGPFETYEDARSEWEWLGGFTSHRVYPTGRAPAPSVYPHA